MFGKSLPMRCRIVPKLPLRIGDVPIGLFEPLQQPLADFDVGTDLQQEVVARLAEPGGPVLLRSEEHTSELQSRENLVCRLLLEQKKYGLSDELCTHLLPE